MKRIIDYLFGHRWAFDAGGIYCTRCGRRPQSWK